MQEKGFNQRKGVWYTGDQSRQAIISKRVRQRQRKTGKKSKSRKIHLELREKNKLEH